MMRMNEELLVYLSVIVEIGYLHIIQIINNIIKIKNKKICQLKLIKLIIAL